MKKFQILTELHFSAENETDAERTLGLIIDLLRERGKIELVPVSARVETTAKLVVASTGRRTAVIQGAR